ncbi:uncharacterized protein LAESUDRAFT_738895 [Laetiporus sulphureus 93-53]|uniref:Uncharacterized protein n=1 Tax=Laetiporus sulphureus 93-53 TaxID=1314785 RepID=A0A165C1G5_9APHY|nr:uncharacterized protein LAESUDRAFT_738895 [Laetiporus sulphureus 93-53]KZT02029.1 hypothetical protein LAESUDRAFT_738895 [Laetiporus sulphureus 93-53]
MGLRSPSSWDLLLLLLAGSLVTFVSGNTEIVNVDATENWDVHFPQSLKWPILSPEVPERLFRVQPAPLRTPLTQVCEDLTAVRSGEPCPHELWLVLDLDDLEWSECSKYTLRISWPASSPADFAIQTYSPELLDEVLHPRNGVDAANSSVLPSKTKRTYARIRVIDTGFRTPTFGYQDSVQPVPFMLKLEPLYLGVLPISVAPVLLFLMAAVAFATVVILPPVNRYLSAIASKARAEITSLQKKHGKIQ